MSERSAAAPDEIAIRRLRPDDAEQLVDCFRRCYGETYVADAFYDPLRLAERVAAQQLRSVVAVDRADGIVGHMGLTIRERPSLTVDAGNTVVDPRCRGQNLAARLAAELVTLCREEGFVGFHHYPTTAHPVMQRLAVAGGGVETGVMLGYIPAGTDYRELAGSAALRLAVVVVYQPLAPAPARRVFVPERYAELVQRAYAEARLEREVREPLRSLDGESIVTPSYDQRRGLLRLSVSRAGDDLAERIEAVASASPADVVHLDLDLSDAGVAAAVEIARRCRFAFCALLPEYAMGDVLRLQRLADPSPELRQPPLVTDGGRRVLAAITADGEG